MSPRSQIQRFQRQGFLIVEDFASSIECEVLVERAEALVDALAFEGASSVFTTRYDAWRDDGYFLDSGDKIRCFFEEDAFEGGRLQVPAERAVNKMGHALHDLDPIYRRFSYRSDLADLAGALGLRRPTLLQSMHIFKHPGVGGEVGWHTDETFLRTDPPSVVGFWFALQDATLENGCLQVLPGLHRRPLKRRFIREGDQTRFEVLDPSPWPCEEATPLEVPAGTLVVLHGRLPHYSAHNRSRRSRQAYALHAIEAGARYPADNWLRRGPGLPLRALETHCSWGTSALPNSESRLTAALMTGSSQRR